MLVATLALSGTSFPGADFIKTSALPEGRGLDALDSHSALAVELVGVALVALLLTVLEALALVVLEQAVLAAEVAVAEAAVADDALGGVLALLVAAADLLRRHAAAQRQGHVQGGVGRDGVVGERRAGRRQVLPCVDEAQVRGLGQAGAQREERAQRGDGCVCRYREGDCWSTSVLRTPHAVGTLRSGLSGSDARNSGNRACNLLEVPETFLTKMCIVSSASEPMELMLEMESERRIMVAVLVCCGAVRCDTVMTRVWRLRSR